MRTTAKVHILADDTIEFRLGRRAQNPMLIAAGFVDGETVVPCRQQRKLRIIIGYDKHVAPQVA